MFESMIIKKLGRVISILKNKNGNIIDKREVIQELESLKNTLDQATKDFR